MIIQEFQGHAYKITWKYIVHIYIYCIIYIYIHIHIHMCIVCVYVGVYIYIYIYTYMCISRLVFGWYLVGTSLVLGDTEVESRTGCRT